MRTLLDTCTLAELNSPRCAPSVREAVEGLADADLFLSVVTIGEIVKGIALLAEGRRKLDLAAWMASLGSRYAERILPVDRETAVIWGEVTARAQQSGVQIPPSDGLIAATALRHGLRVMTRNTRDFQATGALVVDPWR